MKRMASGNRPLTELRPGQSPSRSVFKTTGGADLHLGDASYARPTVNITIFRLQF
jgi:hypothetical protein